MTAIQEDDATMSYYRNDPAYDDRPSCTECGEVVESHDHDTCGPCQRQAEVEIGEELYRSGRPYSACQNDAQREGWGDAEWEAEQAA